MELVFTTCTYDHHTVTVGQHQGTLMSCHTVNITYMLTKIYIFMFEYMKIPAFINITILRSRQYQEAISR